LFFANNTREQIINAFDYIEMTIHRYDKNAHDAFCKKKGAYEFGIHNFKSFESPNVHLGIVYNLTPETFYDIFKVVQQVKEVDNIDIDHVVFQRIAPIGRAYRQDIWNLSQIDLMSIFTQMEKIENEYEINISLEDTFPLCKVPLEYRGKYVRSCPWGNDRCSLDMYGNVSKCCTDPRYTLGNVLNTPLLELWNTSSELDKKRNGGFIPQSCRDCGLYAECGGGCVLSSEMNGCLGDVLLNH
jgi:radical SAM protein with 4Fe4S-binding SPASM domain